MRRLVHEVAAEIEEDPAAGSAIPALFPARLQLRAKPLEPRLEPVHPTELTVGEHPLQREQLGVPSSVLVRRQQHVTLPGELHQVGGLCRRYGEWFVDYYRKADFER